MLSNFTTKSRKYASAMTAASIPAKQPALSLQGPPAGVGARPQECSAPSVIARDLVILGNLTCKGEVHVEGEVQGDIHGATVMIGEHGRIMGGIVSDMVVVRGQVMGSIRGKKVVLQSSSHVEGNIYHQSLAIEPGAYFEGKSRRCEDPTNGVQRTPEIAVSAKTDSDPAIE
jgi:cytoskeletal protein CcmA (bactofilin family)